MHVVCERVLERSDPLQLKLQAFVSHLVWVLGTRLQFSVRAVSALNHGAISSVSGSGFWFFLRGVLHLFLLDLLNVSV